MPCHSGMLSVVKGHGKNTMGHNDTNETKIQIKELQVNAILLIKNPFRILIGYRNHLSAGWKGHAQASIFSGTGMTYLCIPCLANVLYVIIDNIASQLEYLS